MSEDLERCRDADFPGSIGTKISNPDKPVIVISGDGRMQMNIEGATAVLELPITESAFITILTLGWCVIAKLFYGKRYAMTNLLAGAALRRGDEELPKYTPDFVKLAESYGAKGIRIKKKEDVKRRFEQQPPRQRVPALINFSLIREESAMHPMVSQTEHCKGKC